MAAEKNKMFGTIFGSDSEASEESSDHEEKLSTKAVDEEHSPEREEAEEDSPVLGAAHGDSNEEDEVKVYGEDDKVDARREDDKADARREDEKPSYDVDPSDLFKDSDDEEEDGEARAINEALGNSQEQERLNDFEDEQEDDYAERRRERPVGEPLHLKVPLLAPPAPPQKMSLVTGSNIVGFEMKPFDANSFEVGEEGKVNNNVIRWRSVEQADGSKRLESNARIVRWSDGSLQLLLGNELLAVDRQSMRQDKCHLFVRHPKLGVVQGQGRLLEKLKFRPVNLTSNIHKKLALGLDSKYKKTKRVKNIITMKDPEKEKEEMEKVIESRIRSQEELSRRQEREMRKYEKPLPSRGSAMPRRAGYLEEDEDGEGYDRRGGAGQRRYLDEEEEAEASRRILQAKRGQPMHSRSRPSYGRYDEEEDDEMADFIVKDDEVEKLSANEMDGEDYNTGAGKRGVAHNAMSDDEEEYEDEYADEVEENAPRQKSGLSKESSRKAGMKDPEKSKKKSSKGKEDNEEDIDQDTDDGIDTKKFPVAKKRRVVVDSESD